MSVWDELIRTLKLVVNTDGELIYVAIKVVMFLISCQIIFPWQGVLVVVGWVAGLCAILTISAKMKTCVSPNS